MSTRRPDPHPGPRVKWIPKAVDTTDGEDAVFLGKRYGLEPADWQAPILYAWLGRRRDGKWCAGRCGLAVPRQNGKNAVIELRELFGMVVLGEKFLHTAHEVKTARKAFKRLLHFFGDGPNDPNAKYPELNALVVEVRKTNGQEAIVLSNGGSVEFVARSKGSGRGFTVDVLILDEAQALTDDELEAIRSSVSSAPLGNPQVIYTGTPPNRDKGETGEVWLRVRSLAVDEEGHPLKVGKDKRLCWIEYGAPDGPLPDLNDTALLFATNPSLGLRYGDGSFGLGMDVVTDERGELSPAGYARERLGWWGDPKTKHESVINMQAWSNLKVKVPAPDRATLVLDVALDLAWTSIGAAASGRTDNETLVLLHHDAGTSWAVDRVNTMRAGGLRIVEIALTPTAKIFAPGLTKLGIEFKQLTETEVGAGCGWFQERIKTAGIVHTGQPELDAAVKNARTRYVGKIQHWDARDPRVDNSPLVATSVAAQRWALLTAKPDKPALSPVKAKSPSTRRRGSGDINHTGF